MHGRVVARRFKAVNWVAILRAFPGNLSGCI
jgi:hypothetical protein